MTTTRPENLNPTEALDRLNSGNERYRTGVATHPRSDPARRSELTQGQHPFVTILTCADSRVSPELVFDEGLGDLFVIRVAGNIATDAVVGSLEYASVHLGVNLVVVMGHQRCGAVGAAVENKDKSGPVTHDHIDSLIDALRPAVQRASQAGSDDLLERSVRENAVLTADQIRSSKPTMAELGAEGVGVLPAYYSLESGEVTWLD